MAEERLQVLDPAILKVVDRGIVVYAVILEHICVQFGEHHAPISRLDELAHSEFGFPKFAKRGRLFGRVGLSRLAVVPPAIAVVNPQDLRVFPAVHAWRQFIFACHA